MSEPLRWTRTALEARLDALEERHTGAELINAIVDFASTLTEEDKRAFQEVLLKRRRPTVLHLPRRPPPSEDEA